MNDPAVIAWLESDEGLDWVRQNFTHIAHWHNHDDHQYGWPAWLISVFFCQKEQVFSEARWESPANGAWRPRDPEGYWDDWSDYDIKPFIPSVKKWIPEVL